MIQHIKDCYEQALKELEGVCNVLYGGYYEPKSERDLQLGNEISVLINKHRQGGGGLND